MSQLALVCPLILQIKRKEKEKEKQYSKEKKKNNDLADLPSHDTTPLSSFLVLRNFPYSS